MVLLREQGIVRGSSDCLKKKQGVGEEQQGGLHYKQRDTRSTCYDLNST